MRSLLGGLLCALITAIPLHAMIKIQVTHDQLRARDIYPGVNSDQVIQSSPEQGCYVLFDTKTLQSMADQHHISASFVPTETVMVERAINLMPFEAIKERLKVELFADISGEGMDIIFDPALAHVNFPLTSDHHWALTGLSYSPQTKRFKGLVVLGDTGDSFPIAGSTISVMKVPVLSHNILAGDIIELSDITWQNAPSDKVNHHTILDVNQLIGATPRYSMLREGNRVHTQDIKMPAWVTKGETIEVVYQTETLSMRMVGKAMEAGTKNQVIRIVNPASDKTIVAKVTAPHQATVDMMGGAQ